MQRYALLVCIWAAADFVSAAAPFSRDPLPSGATARIGTTRLRHGGTVRALAFSPDGKLLASAGHDATVSLWDVRTGEERFRGRAHTSDVICVHFSPNGKMFASAGADGTVRVYATQDPSPGSLISVQSIKTASVESVAFSPDGQWLAAGDDRGTVHIYNTKNWQRVRSFTQSRSVQSLAWTADSKFLVTRGDSCTAILWDPHTGQSEHRFGKDDPAECLCVSPSGNLLATWESPGVVRLWDIKKRQFVRGWNTITSEEASGRSEVIHQIAFSHDGRSLVAGSILGKVDIWDSETGKKRESFRGHQGRPVAVAVSRAGVIASGGTDHLIQLWKRGRRDPLVVVGAPASPIIGLSVPARGDNLAVLRSTGEIELYNRTTGKRGPAGPAHPARAAALSSDGRTLILADAKRLGVWNVRAQKLTLRAQDDWPVVAVAMAGRVRSLVTAHQDGTLWVRDAAGEQNLRCQGQEKRVVPVLSPDGKVVAGVGVGAGIPLWDAQSGKRLRPLAGHRGGSKAAVFTANGKQLITGGRDRFVRIWDLDNQTEKPTPLGHDAIITALAVAPSGKQIASGTERGDILIWSAESGALLAELEGHRGPVTGLAFSAGGRLLSSGQDTTVLFWDVRDALAGLARSNPLSKERTLELWHTLRDSDAALANLSVERLSRNPATVLPLLRDRLKPIDGKRIAALVVDLDSDTFATRERAFAELEKMGAFPVGVFRATIQKKPGLEAQRRLEILLVKARNEEPASVHRQALRSVEVLGRIGTAQARKILQHLATGDPDADITRLAKVALKAGPRR